MANGIAANGITTAVAWINLAAVFALELAALGALGYAASRGGAPLAVRIALGVGVPLMGAVLWGLFAAPNATVRNAAIAVAVKVLVFGGATIGLVLTGHRFLGAGFAAVVVLTAVLAHVLPTPAAATEATSPVPAAGVSRAAETRP
ncbi:YrdB family protein [Actinopolymorpha sp. NPDC004070]|uniref:YrdB family protein n=1 Tax=Actinopolymorpha sp. NPDC004070 TaxID=3154548 RepID=UPI0033A186EF